jgi:hypothetical protein
MEDREGTLDEYGDAPETDEHVGIPPDEEVFGTQHDADGDDPVFDSVREEGAVPQGQPEQDEAKLPEARVQVGLHPLGGIGISVVGPSGNTEGAQVSIDEAWRIVGHLSALTAMLVGSAYAQHAIEAEQARQQMMAAQNQSKGGVVLPPRR